MKRELLVEANKLNAKLTETEKLINEVNSKRIKLKYVLNNEQYSYTIPLSEDLIKIFRTLALSELEGKRDQIANELKELN